MGIAQKKKKNYLFLLNILNKKKYLNTYSTLKNKIA